METIDSSAARSAIVTGPRDHVISTSKTVVDPVSTLKATEESRTLIPLIQSRTKKVKKQLSRHMVDQQPSNNQPIKHPIDNFSMTNFREKA